MSSEGPGYKSLPLDLNPERTRTLADEILAFIFELCLPAEDDYSPFEIFPLARHAPISVMHICSRWRKIAISNSKLWSVLYLGTRAASEQSIGLLKDILAVWEERSRYRSMAISIILIPNAKAKYGPKSSVDRALRLHKRAWASLLPQLTQLLAHCKWLEIGHSTEDVLRVIEDSDSIQELIYFDDIDILPILPPRPALSKLLRLHSLECLTKAESKCVSIYLEGLLGHAGLSSTKLRRLVLKGRTSIQDLVILATAIPTLEELDVTVPRTVSSPDLYTSQPTLPSPEVSPLHSPLIRLSLVIYLERHSPIASDFELALKDLSFPHLRHLNLVLIELEFSVQTDVIIHSITSVLHRSQSPLESLLLHWGHWQSYVAIAALLHAVPRLVRLTLCVFDTPAALAFVRVLTATTTEKTVFLCPDLESIDFQRIGWRQHGESANNLIELISTRGTSQPAGKLSRLVFQYRSTDEYDARKVCDIVTGSAEFKLCQEQGFVLQTVLLPGTEIIS